MSVKLEILKEAENRVREGGYNGFSFRELAATVGIKSASVHYHFPTKEDLGAEVARYYTDNFMNTLGDPKTIIADQGNPIETYINLFRHALIVDKKMCLCGVFASEADSLPEKIKKETAIFFQRNIEWLCTAYSSMTDLSAEEVTTKSLQTLAILEGAMLIVKATSRDDYFYQITAELLKP